MKEQFREVRLSIPEELAQRVDALAKRCGVPHFNVVCVGLKMVTDIASDDGGLEYLQERSEMLKPHICPAIPTQARVRTSRQPRTHASR